jgi:hypothetical protein
LPESLERRNATQVYDYLAPASEMVRLVPDILEEPSFGIDKRSEVEALTFRVLRAYPQLTTFSAAATKGEFLMVKKMPDGAIDTKNIEISEAGRRVYWIHRNRQNKIVGEEESENDPYDPRVRPWYKGGAENKGLYWTDIYIFSPINAPGSLLQCLFTIRIINCAVCSGWIKNSQS